MLKREGSRSRSSRRNRRNSYGKRERSNSQRNIPKLDFPENNQGIFSDSKINLLKLGFHYKENTLMENGGGFSSELQQNGSFKSFKDNNTGIPKSKFQFLLSNRKVTWI